MAVPGPHSVLYEGMMLPALVHSTESLRYAQLGFQVRDRDIFSVTYPKSGTTWMQELLTLIHSNGDPQLAWSVPSWERVPWVEQTTAAGFLENRPCPRLISSHLPCGLVPTSLHGSNAKVIYTVRNPKDVCVSLYYYSKMASFLEFPEDFGEFVELFSTGKVLFGSWFQHVKGWLGLRDRLNFLLLTYEEMHQISPPGPSTPVSRPVTGPAGQRGADLPVPGQAAGGAGAGRGGGERLLPGHEAEQDVQLQPGAGEHHGPTGQPLPEERGPGRLEGAFHGGAEPGI
ncbi:sulfotransferase 2A1-like isoform X4 [Natator depressus]|uniref:sulfotransferase 2A1-like isoform X4 n=1 Tax=Natator depressus TaxID=27790 RepID=UPI003EC07427